jgi:hypothetical protein
MASQILPQNLEFLNIENGLIDLQLTESEAALLARACKLAANTLKDGEKFRPFQMLFVAASMAAAYQNNCVPALCQETNVYVAGMLELVEG